MQAYKAGRLWEDFLLPSFSSLLAAKHRHTQHTNIHKHAMQKSP